MKVARYVRECATAEEAAGRVVSEAFKARGLRDDITAAVAWLGTPPWVAALLVERKAKRGFFYRGFLSSSSNSGSNSGSSSGSSSSGSSSGGTPAV